MENVGGVLCTAPGGDSAVFRRAGDGGASAPGDGPATRRTSATQRLHAGRWRQRSGATRRHGAAAGPSRRLQATGLGSSRAAGGLSAPRWPRRTHDPPQPRYGPPGASSPARPPRSAPSPRVIHSTFITKASLTYDTVPSQTCSGLQKYVYRKGGGTAGEGETSPTLPVPRGPAERAGGAFIHARESHARTNRVQVMRSARFAAIVVDLSALGVDVGSRGRFGVRSALESRPSSRTARRGRCRGRGGQPSGG